MSNSNETDESLSNETDEQQVERDARWWDDWTNEWDGWEDTASDDQQLGRNDWVQDSDGAYRIVDEAEDIEIDGEITPMSVSIPRKVGRNSSPRASSRQRSRKKTSHQLTSIPPLRT